jgi:hypothetical protein
MSKQISKQKQSRNLIKLLYDRGFQDVETLVKASQTSSRTVKRVIKAIKIKTNHRKEAWRRTTPKVKRY